MMMVSQLQAWDFDKIMNQIGDVVVVAPDSPQSGMGHAITISDTLHVKRKYRQWTPDPIQYFWDPGRLC